MNYRRKLIPLPDEIRRWLMDTITEALRTYQPGPDPVWPAHTRFELAGPHLTITVPAGQWKDDEAVIQLFVVETVPR